MIAVDPTSPFTGGAVLGDRLRMQSHAADEDVFIRSMATRGHLGGLSRATGDAALVLDAAGKDVVIIETVGVGQDEVEIVRTADISIVTLMPGAGDEVQALKAGIMEIADIVVNKADREGADRLVAAVEGTLGLHAYAAGQWRPPIVKTVATSGNGVPELVAAIDAFRDRQRAGPGRGAPADARGASAPRPGDARIHGQAGTNRSRTWRADRGRGQDCGTRDRSVAATAALSGSSMKAVLDPHRHRGAISTPRWPVLSRCPGARGRSVRRGCVAARARALSRSAHPAWNCWKRRPPTRRSPGKSTSAARACTTSPCGSMTLARRWRS